MVFVLPFRNRRSEHHDRKKVEKALLKGDCSSDKTKLLPAY